MQYPKTFELDLYILYVYITHVLILQCLTIYYTYHVVRVQFQNNFCLRIVNEHPMKEYYIDDTINTIRSRN